MSLERYQREVGVDDLTDGEIKELFQLLLNELGYQIVLTETPNYRTVKLQKGE